MTQSSDSTDYDLIGASEPVPGICAGPWPCTLAATRRQLECVCNVGVQECPEHPGRLRTQEEKIAFRKAWDQRVDDGR